MEKLGNKVECDSSIMNTIIFLSVFLSVEIYLANQKEVQYNKNENQIQSAERPQQCGFSKMHKLAQTNHITVCDG